MTVQFAGTLQYQLQLSKVLQRIMDGSPEGLGVLMLTNGENGQNGEIFVAQSHYVCGALLKDEHGAEIESGYEALKILCAMISAKFQYQSQPKEYFENIDLTLNIEIAKILICLPELPDDASELQDTDSLLDRVFTAEVEVSKPTAIKREPPKAKPKSNWHSVPVPLGSDSPEKSDPKYVTLEERALAEMGPPRTRSQKKDAPLLTKVFRRIGYFFLSVYTAPIHLFKRIAIPVLLPLLAIGVLYQAVTFLAPKFRGIKLPSAPTVRRAVPERSVRSTPAYRAPQQHKTVQAKPSQSPATAPVVVPEPLPTYETPSEPIIMKHRRAYPSAPPPP